MRECLQVVRGLEKPEVLELEKKGDEDSVEVRSRELQKSQNLFLEKAWNFVEWAPLRSWLEMEGEVVALTSLGKELCQLQSRWL